MIEEIIEKTKNANEDVKKEAVLPLGKLKELTSKELGTVVIILLNLFEDETLRNVGEKWLIDMRNDPGGSFYELSKKWDLGKAIPKKLRRQVIQRMSLNYFV